MFTLDLSLNVPLYGQETNIWCGAASAQMSRNGYPNPADRLFYPQTDLWNTIQAQNSTDPADWNWATDPHGLTACLNLLSNPPGVHWSEFSNASRDAVLFDILFWMNQRQFASPVLVNQGGHWVVIIGFVTDVAPLAGSNPQLQSISIHDPLPVNVGTTSTMTGVQWFSGLWNGSIIYSGTWFNRYVAVVEPPTQRGRVVVDEARRTGRRLLGPNQAIEFARRWIEELRLADQARYSLLGSGDVENLEPILVRDEPLTGRRRSVPHYYIVPFGIRSEADQRGGRLARVCVLVNGYTGAFEEVSAFGQPVRYLGESEAVAIASAAMRLGEQDLSNVEARLVFRPSEISHVRAWPFWQIQLQGRTVYVDLAGNFFGRLRRSVPGD